MSAPLQIWCSRQFEVSPYPGNNTSGKHFLSHFTVIQE